MLYGVNLEGTKSQPSALTIFRNGCTSEVQTREGVVTRNATLNFMRIGSEIPFYFFIRNPYKPCT